MKRPIVGETWRGARGTLYRVTRVDVLVLRDGSWSGDVDIEREEQGWRIPAETFRVSYTEVTV